VKEPVPVRRRKAKAASLGAGAPFESELRELRAAMANLRAVADALDAAVRSRGARAAELLAAVIAESERASRAVDRLTALANRTGHGSAAGEVMPAGRFAAELARRAAAELDLGVRFAGPIEGGLAVSPEFLEPTLAALTRLRRDYGVSEIALSARRHDDLVALEFAFEAREPESSRLRDEHARVLARGEGGEPALGELARAAGGEAWLAIRRGEATFSLRILLPRAPSR
jgi:hypothetical protein